MIHALSRGKAGKVSIDGEKESWREIFRKREDLLTSMFWSRISYLSEDKLNRFMAQVLSEDRFDYGPLKEVDFWARYNYSTRKKQRKVEPDLVLEFRDIDILIEVKPPFGKGQSKEQWTQEVEAYLQSGSENKLMFLAMGNCQSNTADWLDEFAERYPDVIFKAVSWDNVMNSLKQSLGQSDRIGSDCICLLDCYGIRLPIKSWGSLREVIVHPLDQNGFSSLKADSILLFDAENIKLRIRSWESLREVIFHQLKNGFINYE
jgi:hypothetical protein